MEFFDLVGNVRAMRRLKTDPIPMSMVREILRAATGAPSGQNTQPWAFVAVQESEAKAWLAENYKRAMEGRFPGAFEVDPADNSPQARVVRSVRHQIDHFAETPLVILACGKRDWPFAVKQVDRVGTAPPSYGSIYPAVQNILLACRDLGLGATLTTMHQMFEAEMHERFEIPTTFGVVAMIPIGFPLGKFGPTRRTPAEEVTHFDRWGCSSPKSLDGLSED
jgi:nitroreductase